MAFFSKKVEIKKSKIEGPDKVVLYVVEKKSPNKVHTLSVRVPEIVVPENEHAIKTWGSNKEVSQSAFNTGMFEDTGKRAIFEPQSDGNTVAVEFWKLVDGSSINDIPNI